MKRSGCNLLDSHSDLVWFRSSPSRTNWQMENKRQPLWQAYSSSSCNTTRRTSWMSRQTTVSVNNDAHSSFAQITGSRWQEKNTQLNRRWGCCFAKSRNVRLASLCYQTLLCPSRRVLTRGYVCKLYVISQDLWQDAVFPRTLSNTSEDANVHASSARSPKVQTEEVKVPILPAKTQTNNTLFFFFFLLNRGCCLAGTLHHARLLVRCFVVFNRCSYRQALLS